MTDSKSNHAGSRRRFLKGLGACVGLPALESLWQGGAHAAAAGASAKGAAPLRMAFLYVPNGVILDQWKPTGVGKDYQLNKTMEPLAPHKADFQVFTGFEQRNGTSGPDGAGDHARANATILTGARPKKTAGSDIRLGVSFDQLAAQHLGEHTRLPSLELSCDGVRKSGSCDSGYSCAYQFNLSWRSETTPVAPESNPRAVFERLFGGGTAEERKQAQVQRRTREKSLLDFISEDAAALNKQLGRNDQHKLDEYLTGVREIERRIERAEKFGPLPDPGAPAPAGTPRKYSEHIRLMADMLVLAFQTDSTRVGTFLLAHDGSNRNFEEIGVTDGHHSLSHHMNKPDVMAKIARIDHFYVQQLAYFLQKMKETKDPAGRSLLDSSMVVYASGLSDGNRHKHDNLPVILAGKAGGAFNPGRHVDLGGAVPMNNLYVKMLQILGAPVERFGDSTGVFTNV